MAERLKAAVLKTAVFHDTVGSNPTPSAIKNTKSRHKDGFFVTYRFNMKIQEK